MAISVDTIYQRVLALANKEQRGYITPQEFNLLANQAQMSIFESYFYSKRMESIKSANAPTEIDESDIEELIDGKLAVFQSFETVTSGHTFPDTVGVDGVQYDVFQTGMVMLNDEPCQKVSVHDAQRLKKSARHMASTADQAPIYTDNTVSARDILVYAGSTTAETSNVTVECFRVPKTVNWAYIVVNKKALNNNTLSVDFELHKSETDTLVNKILDLSAIVLNKSGLVQIASGKDASELAIQKIA